MNRSLTLPLHLSRGFTMVEILVGMLIAMLGIVIMTQVSTTFEAQKRTTSGGDDASAAGAITMYQLQRDLRYAGYGFSSRKILGCDLTIGGTTLATFAPVTINSAAIARDANTDSLLVAYGAAAGSPEGDGITAQPSANVYAVQTPGFYAVGDWIIATPATRPNPCTGASGLLLDQVTAVDPAAKTITVATGVAGVANGVIFNQGANFRIVGYAVVTDATTRTANLMRCELTATLPALNCGNAAQWAVVGNGVVGMHALYGKDTSGPIDGVDAWNQTAQATECDWISTRALRIGMVVQNSQYEKTDAAKFPTSGYVTNVAPTWSASTTSTDTPTAIPFDLSANPLWKNYRYKVFETVAPVRNVTYAQSAAQC